MFFVVLYRHSHVLFSNMGIIFAFIDVIMTCNYSPFCIINKTRRTPQCASAIGRSVHFGCSPCLYCGRKSMVWAALI